MNIVFFFNLNLLVHQRKETLTNLEFGQEVSKLWPTIVPSKDQIRVVPERFNLNFNTLITYAQSHT